MKDTHQELMYIAYARWNHYEGALDTVIEENSGELFARLLRPFYWGFEGMLDKVPNVQMVACILGKLNQQVKDGGWYQWADNDYMRPSWAWMENHLPQIGPLSAQVWQIAQTFKGRYDDYVWEREEFEMSDPCEGCHLDDEECERCDTCYTEAPVWIDGPADKDFYAINKEWLAEVLLYLQVLLAEEKGCQLCGKPADYALIDHDGHRWSLCGQHIHEIAHKLGHWVTGRGDDLEVRSIDFTWEDWA
jgi:ferredoxin